MQETNYSEQTANGAVNATSQSNYTQQYSVGKNVKGEVIETKLINGFPYWRLVLANSEPNEYQKFQETIDINGKTDTKFKAIAAMPELSYNGTVAYVVVLTEDGQVGFLYQETTYTTWRWYGLMQNKPGYLGYFNWIAVNNGDKGNAQVVLINDTGTPALLWQDNVTGNWTWDWLPPNQKVNPPNYDLHLTTVQVGEGNNGNLQAIFTGQDGKAYLIWQDNFTGTWTNFGKLPGDPQDPNSFFTLIQLAYGNNNNLQCVCQDENNMLYLIWQDSGSGIWNWYGALPISLNLIHKPIISYMLKESGDTLSLLIVYESDSADGYEIYKILQNAKGVWTWEGRYKTTDNPYPS